MPELYSPGPRADNIQLAKLLHEGILQPHDEVESVLPPGDIRRWSDGRPYFDTVEEFIAWQNMNYLLGNVVKHVTKKDPVTMLRDLRAAEGYLQREIQRLTDNASHQ